jgi:hypothetical protein
LRVPRGEDALTVNPLRRYLEGLDFGPDSRLAVLALAAAAEPFNLEQFHAELVAKLKRLKYPQPQPREKDKTFHNILVEAGRLGVLLRPSTLYELWQCLQLKKIIERDRKLELTDRSMPGFPVRFHQSLVEEISRHVQVVEALARRHGAEGRMEKYIEAVHRQLRDEARTFLLSARYKGAREELLSGRRTADPFARRGRRGSRGPRNEERAAQTTIYWVLKSKLQTKRSRDAGISDALLRQLAELVLADPAVKDLSDGEAIRRFIERLSRADKTR